MEWCWVFITNLKGSIALLIPKVVQLRTKHEIIKLAPVITCLSLQDIRVYLWSAMMISTLPLYYVFLMMLIQYKNKHCFFHRLRVHLNTFRSNINMLKSMQRLPNIWYGSILTGHPKTKCFIMKVNKYKP